MWLGVVITEVPFKFADSNALLCAQQRGFTKRRQVLGKLPILLAVLVNRTMVVWLALAPEDSQVTTLQEKRQRRHRHRNGATGAQRQKRASLCAERVC